ncbi:MAG: AraC family transcriptional regulator [Eubacteriales bacterium]
MNISGCFSTVEDSLGTKNQFDMSLYYAGQSRCLPLHENVGIRDHYLIHFVLDGEGVLHVGNEAVPIGKNQAFIIYPDEYAKYCADADNPWEYCWLGLGGAYISFLLDKTGFSKKNHVIQFEDSKKLEFLINTIILLNKASDDLYFSKISYLMQVFELLEGNSKPQDSRSIKYVHFNNAVEFVQKNYSIQISVNDIAKYVGVERKYLSYIFKTMSNTSPKQYLTTTRLNRAAIMLTESNLSIQEVAYSVGYSDPLLFSKSFKNAYGVCPRDFKNRAK